MRHIKVSFFFLITIFLILNIVAAQSGGTINYGDTVRGNITDDEPIHDWTFEGSAGELITITMNAVDIAAGGLDSYLQLLDAAGEIIAENDDASPTTINAAIEDFPLPTDGSYTIRATRFGLETGLAVGEYDLTLSLAEEGEATETAPPADEEGQPITYDTPVSGTLNRQNFEDRLTFEGQEGDVITIRMDRSNPNTDLDPFLQLLDNEDRELVRNDDSPEGVNVSEITGFTLPYSGNYSIVATRYGFESGTSSGDYSLEIITGVEPNTQPPTEAPTEEPTQEPTEEATEAPTEEPTPAPQVAGAIAYGDSVTGSGAAAYTFDGVAGDVVTISAKRASGDFNPALTLLDADGNVLAENTEFNGAADARIVEFALPADGTYTIDVEQETAASGEFILRIFSGETTPVVEATPEPIEEMPAVDLSNATLAVTLSWEGTADFDISLTDPNGDTIDYLQTSSESGGIFGGDANGGCVANMATPAESVYWESAALSGNYQVGVAFVFPCGVESPVSYTITITLNGEVIETIEDELNEGEFKSYEHSLD